MPFRFVKWLLGQKDRKGILGEIANDCLNDPNFPIDARHIDEVLEYLTNNATKKEVQTVRKAWNEFRTLGKVKVYSLNLIKSR